MLILSRRAGESLRIGDDVEVTVLRVSAGQVSLGIRAPKQVAVLRGELAAAIAGGNVAAAGSAPAGAELEALKASLGKGMDDRPGRGEARQKAPQGRRAGRKTT